MNEKNAARTLARSLAAVQGGYFVLTGIWPLLHMPSFEAVTGRKTVKWLVKTVGALVAVIGGTLIASARREPDAAVKVLGAASAATLGIVDVNYVARGVIPPVYLLDAVPEFGLAAAWVRSTMRPQRAEQRLEIRDLTPGCAI